jgi:superoxide dismutase, Cu-Zn family
MKILACAAALLSVCGAVQAQQPTAKATAKPVILTIKDAQGQAVGTATLTPATPAGVKIVLDIKKLPPGEHSIHIHQFAKCDPPDFKSAGGHFDPGGSGHMHGSAPAGDIPDFSLNVGKDGTAHVSTVDPNVSLGDDDHSVFSNGGTALVIHAIASTTGSGAPPRIACAEIVKP